MSKYKIFYQLTYDHLQSQYIGKANTIEDARTIAGSHQRANDNNIEYYYVTTREYLFKKEN